MLWLLRVSVSPLVALPVVVLVLPPVNIVVIISCIHTGITNILYDIKYIFILFINIKKRFY